MTNKELNTAIKKELKEAGYNPRAFSVRVSDAGYSTRVDIEIKSPDVNRADVENLLRHREEYETDERTGEILAGGNTYLFISYAPGVFDEVAQEWAATAAGAMRSTAETTEIFRGLYLLNIDHAGRLQIRQQDAREHCTYNVYNMAHLCEFLYKFAKFGKISV